MISNFKIAVLLSYFSVASFSAALITPALPEIQQQFHLSAGAVEWLLELT